ncbi:MAG: histidine phosphatase family protein [Bacilli bacterium]|nr:histidine phosphatase family protein [Bacilli bacterium]
MKITLVRHGQTESNYLDICQGSSNILLNDTGRRECQRLREKIKDKHYDVCYMSPLVRTVETAMILIGDKVQMIPERKLIDRDLGELEGKERSLYDANKYWDYNLNCSEQGVEPVQDIFKRCREFLDYILEKHKDESVLIVAHAATIRAIRHLLLKTDLSKSLLHDDIKNCYYEEIEV